MTGQREDAEDINESDIVVLGGNIELSGFREVDGGSMIVLKKIVGNYVKQLSENHKDFEKLHISMKKVHETKGSSKYEVTARIIISGKPYNADVTERNLFMTVDKVLKKIESIVK